MYREVLAERDVLTVGECPGIPADKAMDFVGDDRNEQSMFFHFGEIMAASIIVTIPLLRLVLIFQKKIVEGLTRGAVKG